MSYTVGIDLGGTRIKAVALDAAGAVLARANEDNGGADAAAWTVRIASILAAWRAELGADPTHIGICAPGLAGRDAVSIEFMPGRMEALQGHDWTRALAAPVPVRVLNDAHAALLGELAHGAARGASNAVLFTLGTGVGGAVLANGKLVRGAIGRAGHLGHISLDPNGAPGITRCPGPLEDAIGNHNLALRTGGRYHDTAALLAAVDTDPLAAEAWGRSVRALGAAIVSVINVLDPEIIVLGGGIAASGEALFSPLRAYLDAHEWRPGGHRVTVVPAALGDAAGALGAAYFAVHFGELT